MIVAQYEQYINTCLPSFIDLVYVYMLVMAISIDSTAAYTSASTTSNTMTAAYLRVWAIASIYHVSDYIIM